jgi:hypothetical protein
MFLIASSDFSLSLSNITCTTTSEIFEVDQQQLSERLNTGK